MINERNGRISTCRKGKITSKPNNAYQIHRTTEVAEKADSETSSINEKINAYLNIFSCWGRLFTFENRRSCCERIRLIMKCAKETDIKNSLSSYGLSNPFNYSEI